MPEKSFDKILEHIGSRDAEETWNLFLDDYGTTVLQVVRQIERDSDFVPDCFQFVCEQLSANSLQRLRKFRLGGGAVFSTWLRAVVRNLCLDWHRKRFGRRRLFSSISRLSSFDQDVFRCLYERRLSVEDTFQSLRSIYPNLTHAQLAQSATRVGNHLTAKQRRLLDSRNAEPEKPGTYWDDASQAQLADPAPDPEAQTITKESEIALRRALDRLPARERLLMRLRYEQELTLEQIAGLLDLGNAQRADREIKVVLTKLRKEFE